MRVRERVCARERETRRREIEKRHARKGRDLDAVEHEVVLTQEARGHGGMPLAESHGSVRKKKGGSF